MPYLLQMGRIGLADRMAFSIYCEQWATCCEMIAAIESIGADWWTQMSPKGEVMMPEIKDFPKAATKLLSSAARFGLTPRSRNLTDRYTGLPTELKELRKSAPLTSMTTKDRVVWDKASTDHPGILQGDAVDEYNLLREALDPYDLFSPLDVSTAAVIAAMFSIRMRANQARRRRLVTISDKEVYYTHPLLLIVDEYDKSMYDFAAQFAVTPQARKRFCTHSKQEGYTPGIYLGVVG